MGPLILIGKGLRYLTDDGYRFNVNRSHFGMYRDMPDEKYIKRMFRYKMGYELDLENPKTFSEKLQWLKLYDRRPEYTIMVDKYEAKKYVAERIGEEYIIPTLGVWNHFEEIDFDTLPDQFVLKCTHDSHGLSICKDKAKWDKQEAKKRLEKGLKRNYYYNYREWPYKDVKPRIIAEKYMEDSETYNTDLIDYKFYCFGGIPTYCQVIKDRTINEKIDFFDMKWKRMPFTGLHSPGKPYPHSDKYITQPVSFELMQAKAKLLSQDLPFVRIDFYDIKGRLYFGEITFYPASGLGIFEPDEWNYKLGEMIQCNLLIR